MEGHRMREKVFKNNRWFAVLETSFNGRLTIPMAHYVWLKGNPSFIDIPKGYVIHHLDHDEVNDDITNLVLMQKHHHAAYHWKAKVLTPAIRLQHSKQDNDLFVPLAEPVIKKHEKYGYFLYFIENINGARKRRSIYRVQGKKFNSMEDAEQAKAHIWG
jgi:hypothetical protein